MDLEAVGTTANPDTVHTVQHRDPNTKASHACGRILRRERQLATGSEPYVFSVTKMCLVSTSAKYYLSPVIHQSSGE
eukprot:1186219-Prorocentrum_minimum.AAC.1